ncbi:MAG: hypothetical protein BGO52_11445 [Sphingobacteriales bacterium 44-61]|nr:MAG: hypothetical protein BGO52_11445 [Sphingobacteriales bacterium 44-61]
MSSAVNKEKSKIYETILSSPGMTEKCKVVLQLSRQNVLLLSRLIEAGLLTKEQPFEDEIIRALPAASTEEFKAIHEEILRKAELTEFYERLKLL